MEDACKIDMVICEICHGIFENATTCFGCGHTFCEVCLKSSLAAKVNCPTCQKDVKCTAPNLLAQSIIDQIFKSKTSLQVVNENRTKRRKLGPESFVGTDSENYLEFEIRKKLPAKRGLEDQLSYEWTFTDETPYKTEEFQRAILQMERKLEIQFRLREANIKKQYQRKLKEMRSTMEKERVHDKLLNLCRNWIHFKPVLMHDFVVYLVFETKNKKEKTRSKILSCLLCGIPGPEKTPWEGCLVPLKIKYNC